MKQENGSKCNNVMTKKTKVATEMKEKIFKKKSIAKSKEK